MPNIYFILGPKPVKGTTAYFKHRGNLPLYSVRSKFAGAIWTDSSERHVLVGARENGPASNDQEVHEWGPYKQYKIVGHQIRWLEPSNATDKGGVNKIGRVGTGPIRRPKRLGIIHKIAKSNCAYHLLDPLDSLELIHDWFPFCLEKVECKNNDFKGSVQFDLVLPCVSGNTFGRITLWGSGSGLVSFIATLSGCFATCLSFVVVPIPLSMVRNLVCDINSVIWSLFITFWTPVPSFSITFKWLRLFSML